MIFKDLPSPKSAAAPLAAPGFDGLQADGLLATPGAATPSVEFDGSRSTGNGGGTGPVDFFGMFQPCG